MRSNYCPHRIVIAGEMTADDPDVHTFEFPREDVVQFEASTEPRERVTCRAVHTLRSRRGHCIHQGTY